MKEAYFDSEEYRYNLAQKLKDEENHSTRQEMLSNEKGKADYKKALESQPERRKFQIKEWQDARKRQAGVDWLMENDIFYPIQKYNSDFGSMGIFMHKFGNLNFSEAETESIEERKLEWQEKIIEIKNRLKKIGLNIEIKEKLINPAEYVTGEKPSRPVYSDSKRPPFDGSRLRDKEGSSRIFVGIEDLDLFMDFLDTYKNAETLEKKFQLYYLFQSIIIKQVLDEEELSDPTDGTLSFIVNMDALLNKYREIVYDMKFDDKDKESGEKFQDQIKFIEEILDASKGARLKEFARDKKDNI